MTTAPEALTNRTADWCIKGVDYDLDPSGNCIWIYAPNGSKVRIRMLDGAMELHTLDVKGNRGPTVNLR